jgi:hypothetical protein
MAGKRENKEKDKNYFSLPFLKMESKPTPTIAEAEAEPLADSSHSAENPYRTTMTEEEEQEASTTENITHDTETGEPILIERTRSNFSYNSNDLKQRSKEKEKEKETSSANDDEHNNNGGGFYECNIW